MDTILINDLDKIKFKLDEECVLLKKILEELRSINANSEKGRYAAKYGTLEGFSWGWEDKL